MTADEQVAGVPRLCARQAGCTRPRGHDDECGPDRDQARVARYAAALSSARLDAVLTVADTELAEARAEVERLKAERDALQRQATRVRRYAESKAVTSRARGRADEEREWLDVLALLDAVEPADQPHPTPEAVQAARDASDAALAAATDGKAPSLLGRPPEAKPGLDRHAGRLCFGWHGSRWHNPEHFAPHIHCDVEGCVAECQPCSVGDGFHRSSPHPSPEADEGAQE